VKISRRAGSGFGLGFGAFLASFLPLSLLPMAKSMTQTAARGKSKSPNCTAADQWHSGSKRGLPQELGLDGKLRVQANWHILVPNRKTNGLR
jgi:hypothetical protein